MILVLGSNGFLGKRVCHKLKEKKIPYIGTSFSIGVDLREKDQTFKLFEKVKPTYVINCASYVGGIQFGYKHPGELFYNNTLMTANILEACRIYNIKRLINPISNCAYPGNLSIFKESEFWNGPLHESVMVYGQVRKNSWVGSWAYAKQYNLDTINLILSNMYGPEDHFDEERSHALGALIKKIVYAKFNKHPEVIIWGTGSPVREWLHVDDGAEAMIKALDIQSYIDPINIGVQKGISIKELSLLIRSIVKYDGELVFDVSKPDGAPYKTVDGKLGNELLNWSPKTNLKTGITETIEWYIENNK
jgi:GDP-L-fucose synthase